MKCPKCKFVSYDHLDNCKKCGRDLTEDKARLGIRSLRKKEPESLSVFETSEDVSGTSLEASKDSEEPPSFEPEDDAFSVEDVSFGEPVAPSHAEEEDQEEAFSLASSPDDEDSFFSEDLEDIEFNSEFEPTFDGQVRADEADVLDYPEEEGEALASPALASSEMDAAHEPGAEDEVTQDSGLQDVAIKRHPARLETDGDLSPMLDAGSGEDGFSVVSDEAEAAQDLSQVTAHEAATPDFPVSEDTTFPESGQMPLAFDEGEEAEEGEDDEEYGAEAIPDIDEIKKGGFFRRFIAFAVDTAVQAVIIYAFILAAFYALKKGVAVTGEGLSIEHLAHLLGPVLFLIVIVNAGYFTFFHWATGQTPGKMILGLKVVGKDGSHLTLGRSFLRWFSYLLSALPFMLGYLVVLFDRQKQALHDRIAGTFVIDVRGLAAEGEDDAGEDDPVLSPFDEDEA